MPSEAPPTAEAVIAVAEAFSEPFEGFSAVPYRCPAGVWTIGLGSTRDSHGYPVLPTTPQVTIAEARTLALRDMAVAFTAVAHDVKVRLDVNQEAALTDFVYNLGAGAFKSSTLLRDINSGNMAAAEAQFDLWDHSGGKVLAGLLRRRNAELALFKKDA